MMHAQSQPNTIPTKPMDVPDRSNLITLLEAASSLDYMQVNDDDDDDNATTCAGESQQTQTAGEPTSTWGKKAPSSAAEILIKKKVATARPAAKLTLTQLLIASKKDGDVVSGTDAAKKTQKATKKTKKPPKPTFPQELMRMVTDEANASTIAFLPCGKRIIVLDQEAFLNDVLPKSALAMQAPNSTGIPGKVKISSFTRRLNRWGFLQCRIQGLENHLVFAHPKFLRDDPKLCMEIKSGFVSTAAKLKALPRTAPVCAGAAAAQSNKPNNDGFKTPAIDASTSLGSAPRTTCTDPLLPRNVYHRPVLKVEESEVRSAGSSFALPLFHAHRTSTKPIPSNYRLDQELILQTKYAQLLRLQANIQRRAVNTTFLGDGAGTTSTPASSQTTGSTFLPHAAVMAATRTVTAGAMGTIRRDRSLFGQVSQDSSATIQPQSRDTCTANKSRLREREMIFKRALVKALYSNRIEYNNRAA